MAEEAGGAALLGEAVVAQRQGEHARAERCYLAYLAAVPADARARAGYAGLLATLGRREAAIEAYRQALASDAGLAEAASNLALLLGECAEFEEAEEWLLQALAQRPELVAARLNLGVVQQELGKLEASAASFERAVRDAPDSAAAHFNLANGHARLFRLEEAEAAYRAALRIDPDFVGAHWNLSHVLLLQGRLREGWEAFEYRWQVPSADVRRAVDRLWSGEEIAGRRLFIWSEQGYGDTLQFIRYAMLAAQRGARVFVHTRAPLVRLLQGMTGIEAVATLDEPVPEYDFQCPVMSLPRAFGTTLDSIPWEGPYLRADPAQAAQWKIRLDAGARLRVGLAWSSGIRAYNREVFYAGITKSVALGQLNPLARVRGVQFVSLQTGPQAAEAGEPPQGMRIADWSRELRDFAATAALIENLDLVITVDTAVAHLAAAMGKPVWVLVKYHACWRWLRDREDTPWYPTLRLFRQREPEDWAVPIREAARALETLAGPETGGGLVARASGWLRSRRRRRTRAEQGKLPD